MATYGMPIISNSNNPYGAEWGCACGAELQSEVEERTGECIECLRERDEHKACLECGEPLTDESKSARSNHQCVDCHIDNPFGIFHE